MTRRRRLAAIIGTALAGLALLVAIAGILVVRTQWFRDGVRAKIVSAVESATGGKAAIGSFSFDWRHLQAEVHNFTIHGLEGPGTAPLFHADFVQVNLKLTSPFHKFVDIAYLLLDAPQANVIVYTDGHTNLPAPNVPAEHSNKTGLETIVDLAIGRFDLRHGSFSFGDQKSALNTSGGNFRAQLAFRALKPAYVGEVDISPLHIDSNGGAPLDLDVKLPLTLASDRIEVAQAQLRSAQSHVVLSATMEHLIAPHTSVQVNGQIALEELKGASGATIPLDPAHGPRILQADASVSADPQITKIQSAHIILGQSRIDASGNLGNGQEVNFTAALNLDELGRLLRVSAQPAGTVRLAGSARLQAGNRYSVDANLDARQLAFREGATRVAGVDLDAKVSADPDRIALGEVRLRALGGNFSGNAALSNMSLFQVSGRLQGLGVEQLSRTFLQNSLGYDGAISGSVEAKGNLQKAGDVEARVNLAIVPSTSRKAGMVPLAGKINADFNGGAGTVTLLPSYIALPHTRADLNGQLGRQIQVRLVSTGMADLEPLGKIPVALAPNGAATVNANVTGSLSTPRISGTVALNEFSVQGRPFTRFAAAFDASPAGVAVSNGLLTRGPLAAQLAGGLGLRNWTVTPASPLRADATIRNADIQDLLAVMGESALPIRGALSVDAHIGGTLGSPTGAVDASAASGFIEGEKFDSFTLRGEMVDDSITVPAFSLVAGASRLDGTASFRHPRNDLTQGSLAGKVTATQVQLAQFRSLIKDRPGLSGSISLNADASADLRNGEIVISAVNGNIAAKGLSMESKPLGDLTATAVTQGTAVRYTLNSDFAGSTVRVNGQTDLQGDHRTTANASIANLAVDRVLAMAGRRDLPFTGSFAGTAQVSGTLADPHAAANFTVTNGSAYQEPFTSLQAEVDYTNLSIDVPRFHLADGPAFIDANVSLTPSSKGAANSDVRFHVTSNQIHLAGVRAVKQYQPALDGVVQLTADGAATLRPNETPLVSSLNANLRATGVSVNKQNLGDLTATADTHGSTVDFKLVSNLVHSDVQATGSMQLAGDYPVNAHLTFRNLTYDGVSALLTGQTRLPVDASVEGEMSLSGPVANVSRLQGNLQISKLEAHSAPVSGVGAKPRVNLDLKSAGPITATLDHGIVTLANFQLTGTKVNFKVGGTASFNAPRPIHLSADGSVDLGILEAFSSDIYSSGTIALHAGVGGTAANPDVNGTLQLQKASLNLLDLPNGISNATGIIAFNGTEASIRNVTGETGGGKVTLSGTVAYGGPQMQLHVQASANHVHIRYPDTITTEANASLSLNGTADHSIVTGTVRVLDVSLHQGADVGNVLTAAATPPSTSTANPGPLAGMRFDVHISTSPGAQFRTTLTQNLQASANLSLLGSVQNPGMLGRVTVTGGNVVFFGNEYSIDQGTLSFFDTTKINPILNVELKTTVQGVDVAVNVTGPADKMKLAYSSDPPLQFEQLVSLLASGKTPTTDPVLAAHAPPAPQQNLQQTGASAVLGQAFANPISGRLQRLFGVSKLSIDPQIIGTTNTAQATLTLQQQITRDITFTYIEDVTDSNPEIVRVEWDINPRYSAVAQRDVNGELTVNLFYKKKFR